jgi:hypothetical protein
MIITDKIIWPHIPKTAGCKTREIFLNAYRDKVLLNTNDITSLKQPQVPHSQEIPKKFRNKKRKCVVGFRGLFSWLMSKANYHFVMGDVNVSRQEIIDMLREGKTLHANGETQTGDEFISRWMDFINPSNGVYSDILDHEPIFIRQEYYEKDMRKALLLQEHYLTDQVLNEQFTLRNNSISDCIMYQGQMGKELTEDKMTVRVKDLELTEELVEYIYAQNPLWDQLEGKIYKGS